MITQVVQIEERYTGLRAYSLAPGVIDTGMQERLRGLSSDELPDVAKFLELKQKEAFNTPSWVAKHLLAMAFDPTSRPEKVVCSLPNEKSTRCP
jgi:benzil reductase ((S)-benzoin forming)